jgi:hypothetical protein
LIFVPEIIINNDTVHSGRKWLVKYGTTTISTQRPLWPIFRTLNCFRNVSLIFHLLVHSDWHYLFIIENIYCESSESFQFSIFNNLPVILFSKHTDLPRVCMLIFWPKYLKSEEFFGHSQFGPVCDMCYSWSDLFFLKVS